MMDDIGQPLERYAKLEEAHQHVTAAWRALKAFDPSYAPSEIQSLRVELADFEQKLFIFKTRFAQERVAAAGKP